MKRIMLIVDDDVLVRHMLKRRLQSEMRKLGIELEVLEACDGNDAEQIVRSRAGSIDLILSDVNMPKCDGLAFFLAVRDVLGRCSIPFWMMSGDDFQRIPAEVTKRFRKPSEWGLLISAMKELFIPPAGQSSTRTSIVIVHPVSEEVVSIVEDIYATYQLRTEMTIHVMFPERMRTIPATVDGVLQKDPTLVVLDLSLSFDDSENGNGGADLARALRDRRPSLYILLRSSSWTPEVYDHWLREFGAQSNSVCPEHFRGALERIRPLS